MNGIFTRLILVAVGVAVASIMGVALLGRSGILGCGGGGATSSSSTETVTATLKDADGTALQATGTTTTDPTALIITFQPAADQASVTTAGNIALACGDRSPSIEVALSPDDAADGVAGNEYRASVADAYAVQLRDCTLTITTNVKSASGSPLAAPIAFTFTNPCAVSDGFDADSNSCWQVAGPPASTWDTWSDLKANILSFDTSADKLVYDTTALGAGPADGTVAVVYKTVSVAAAGFEIVLNVSASGIDDNLPDGSPDTVSIALCQNPGVGPAAAKCYALGFISAGGGLTNCGLVYTADGATVTAMSTSLCNGDVPLYFRMRGENGTVRAQSSTDGVTYGDFANVAGSFPTSEDFSALRAMNLKLFERGPFDNRAWIDSIVVSGITADGQY